MSRISLAVERHTATHSRYYDAPDFVHFQNRPLLDVVHLCLRFVHSGCTWGVLRASNGKRDGMHWYGMIGRVALSV